MERRLIGKYEQKGKDKELKIPRPCLRLDRLIQKSL